MNFLFRCARLAVTATALSGCVGLPRSSGELTIAITSVTVVDPGTDQKRVGQTIVIRGHQIVAIGDSASVAVPAAARIVDGRGRFALPGLWDMHVHLSMAGRDAFPVLLSQGVTSVRDMGGEPVVLHWRDSVRSGALLGPNIIAAGRIVESKAWVDAVLALPGMQEDSLLRRDLTRRLTIATVDDARRAVDSLVAMGSDFVKIRNYPSPAATFALLREARLRGLKVVGHAPPPMVWVSILADSGFHTYEHQFLTRNATGLTDGIAALADSARDDLWRRLALNDVAWTPTLVAQQALTLADSTIARWIAEDAPSSPSAGLITPRLRDEWRSALVLRRANPDASTNWQMLFDQELGLVAPALARGVRLLVGSDLGVAGVVPGRSVHDELALLVRAGVPPMHALRAATLDAANAAGHGSFRGRLAEGYEADLILVDADPTVEIGATRRIVAVMARGRWFVAPSRDTR